MSKRRNTFTRFIEDIVDDTKDFVDDVLDRTKDVENHARDAVKDAVDDDESYNGAYPTGQMASLENALAELTAKVNQLAELQLASAGGSSSSTAKRSTAA